ncbi:MAG: DinB family protein [Ferruginibacter sp.]
MQTIIDQLEQILKEYAPLFTEIPEAEFAAKPLPHKWSKKEILGHLIDSAQNNIRRFVVSQYEEKPFIKYAQDNWVSAAGYQNYDTSCLVELWILLNRHAAVVLKNMSPVIAERVCDTGELHSLKWLAHDYNQHLLHHLHQILNLEEIAYP